MDFSLKKKFLIDNLFNIFLSFLLLKQKLTFQKWYQKWTSAVFSLRKYHQTHFLILNTSFSKHIFPCKQSKISYSVFCTCFLKNGWFMFHNSLLILSIVNVLLQLFLTLYVVFFLNKFYNFVNVWTVWLCWQVDDDVEVLDATGKYVMPG